MEKKSILVRQIQQLAGVEGVELIMVEPCEPDYMLVHINFDPDSVVDRLTPEEVAQRNYAATERRGLITMDTEIFEFSDKIHEEATELFKSIHSLGFDPSELADVSLVCDAMALHYAIDLQSEKERKMLINETRK